MCAQIQLLINSISDELKEYKEKYVNAMNELKTQEKVYNETCDCYEVYVRQRGLEGNVIKLRNDGFEENTKNVLLFFLWKI